MASRYEFSSILDDFWGPFRRSFSDVSATFSELFSERFQECPQRRLFTDLGSIFEVILESFSELFGDRAKV